MKEIVKILKKKYGRQLAALQDTANIVGVKDKDADRWDGFVKSQLMKIIGEDDNLMEKFVNAAFDTLVAELAIKPDPKYKPTEKETAMHEIAKGVAKLFADLDIDLEKILK